MICEPERLNTLCRNQSHQTRGFFKIFEEAVCAGIGHRKFGGQDFVKECLELFDPRT